MLKSISAATSGSGCGYFKSKCAEIHYLTSNFSILCIFCGFTTLDYSLFIEHFRCQHFDSITKTLQCMTEPIITQIFEEGASRIKHHQSQRAHNDPLECEDKEIHYERNEDDQIGDIKGLKTESFDGKHAITLQNNTSNKKCKIVRQSTFTESDDELLICKVKLEQKEGHTINPLILKTKENQTTQPDGTSVPSVRSVDISTDINNENDSNSEHGVNYNTSSQKTEDIDWSKPYEPNLLKNHDKRPYKPRNRPNICTYCGRTFRRRYQLDTHLNIHTGSKPHQCDICGRQFRAVTTLTRHLNTHEQRTAYTCKFCEKAFTHKAALLSHELRHTQERNIPCDECEKLFYTINQMDTHKRKVHHKADDDALPFACDLCTKRYRSASMLSTHKFKKHYRTAKYSCEKCDKKFVDEQQYEAHKIIHVGSMSSIVIQ